jgi:F420H(2)-dependent quinone reductase
MNDISIKWFMKFNTFLLRVSHGRLGSQLGKQQVLILHTTGRKSGEDRAIPIAYFEHENNYLIVASNWGKPNHANWYLNLKHNAKAILEIKGKRIDVTAHEAENDEYQQLWDFVTTKYPPYLDYQKQTTRKIPVMVFEQI